MSISPRSTVSLPKVRFAQLQALAERRALPNPAALIEFWINRAIEEGELPALAPGFSCAVADGRMQIEIAGHPLPPMAAKPARMLAAILSAAAGGSDPELAFMMPPGRPVALDLGEHILAVGRAGTGVRFVLRDKDQPEVDGISFATSAAFVTGLSDAIRETIAKH